MRVILSSEKFRGLNSLSYAIKGLVAIVLIIVALFTLQCREARRESPPKNGFERGVESISNPSHPLLRERLTLASLQKIGSDKEGQYIFVRPWKLAVDNLGRLFVLDLRDANIKVFDALGRFLWTIGKKGAGPGEFMSPVGMIFGQRSELAVYDHEIRRLTFFDMRGHYLRSSSTATFPIAIMSSDSRGNIYCSVPLLRYGEIKFELRKYDQSLENYTLIHSTDWAKNEGFQLFTRPLLGFFIDYQDRLVYGSPRGYELRVVDDRGVMQKMIKKAFTPLPIPKAEIEFAKKGFPADVHLAIPDHYAPFYALYGDDEGRIIVETCVHITGDKEHFFDVFDSAGKYVAVVTLGPHRECLWKNQRLYMIEEDDEGLPVIGVYSVDWTTGPGPMK